MSDTGDMERIAAALDRPSGGIVHVRALRVLDWGRELALDCVYREPDSGRETPFALRFRDCRELKWRVYAHAAAGQETALADVRLGRDGHRSPAHLLAEHFGLALVYGELRIERGGGDDVL